MQKHYAVSNWVNNRVNHFSQSKSLRFCLAGILLLYFFMQSGAFVATPYQSVENSLIATNLIMTTYFIHQADPIMNRGGVMKYDIEILNEFLRQVKPFSENLHCALFIDWEDTPDVSIEFVYADFTKTDFSINDYRYFLYRDYLAQHTQFQQILMIDLKDVKYGRDPFELMASMSDKKLFVGTELDRTHYRKYLKYKLKFCFGDLWDKGDSPERIFDAFVFARDKSKKDKTLLINAGIGGGQRSYIMDLLEDMVSMFEALPEGDPKTCNTNMLVFLAAILPFHKQGIVFTGAPFHSPFQSYLEPNSSFAIYHK